MYALNERNVGIVFDAVEYDLPAVGSNVEVARNEIARQLVKRTLHSAQQIDLQKAHVARVDPQHEE